MKSSRFFFFCLALLAAILLPVAARAANGIPAGTYVIAPDVLPFSVAGTAAIHRTAFVVTAAGQGTIRIDYVTGNTIATATYSVVRQDGPSPEPEPEPEPEPDPTPPTELWGVVIEESDTRTPEQAAIYMSTEVRKLFEKTEFRIVDPVNDAGERVPVSAFVKPYVERALAAKSLPMLFLVDAAGKVYYEGPLPATTAAMLKLVQETLKGGAR